MALVCYPWGGGAGRRGYREQSCQGAVPFIPTKRRSSSSLRCFSSLFLISCCLFSSCSCSNLLVRSRGGLTAYFLGVAFSFFLTVCHSTREASPAPTHILHRAYPDRRGSCSMERSGVGRGPRYRSSLAAQAAESPKDLPHQPCTGNCEQEGESYSPR